MLWQHNSNPSYKLASIPRYDDIVRTAGGRRSAGDGGAPKTARRIREAGAAGPPATSRRRGGGVLNITAAVWTVGFHWWRSGNKKRTQNVSEYMLVLAVCLVMNMVLIIATSIRKCLASNMDAVNSKSCLPFSQTCGFGGAPRRPPVVGRRRAQTQPSRPLALCRYIAGWTQACN